MDAIRKFWIGLPTLLTAVIMVSAPAAAQQQQKTNIVIFWGDDIGQSDISANRPGSFIRPANGTSY
jgi:hypothetical protein